MQYNYEKTLLQDIEAFFFFLTSLEAHFLFPTGGILINFIVAEKLLYGFCYLSHHYKENLLSTQLHTTITYYLLS